MTSGVQLVYTKAMNIDYRPDGEWEKLCNEWSEGLHFTNGFVRVHQGLPHALMEVGLGLSKLLPHKKRFYYFKDLNPHFNPLFMALATEGYEAKELSLKDMECPREWVEGIDSRRDLFVLYSVDDPVFSRLFSTDKMESLTSGKRLFRLCVSHNKHKYIEGPKEQDSYKINLYSMDFQTCISHFSKEAPSEEIISSSLNWSHMSQQVPLFNSLKENKDLILSFERAVNTEPLFENIPRIFDRAIVYWEDMDGLALIDQVSKNRGLSLAPPGEDQNFETTSLSRWGSGKSMEWLRAFDLSPNQQRGLVIFRTNYCRTPLLPTSYYRHERLS